MSGPWTLSIGGSHATYPVLAPRCEEQVAQAAVESRSPSFEFLFGRARLERMQSGAGDHGCCVERAAGMRFCLEKRLAVVATAVLTIAIWILPAGAGSVIAPGSDAVVTMGVTVPELLSGAGTVSAYSDRFFR